MAAPDVIVLTFANTSRPGTRVSRSLLLAADATFSNWSNVSLATHSMCCLVSSVRSIVTPIRSWLPTENERLSSSLHSAQFRRLMDGPYHLPLLSHYLGALVRPSSRCREGVSHDSSRERGRIVAPVCVRLFE